MSFFHKHSLTIVVLAVVANVKAILVSIRLAIIWIRRSSISEVKKSHQLSTSSYILAKNRDRCRIIFGPPSLKVRPDQILYKKRSGLSL